MKVLLIQIALLLFLNCLYSAILEVNQDGSTPYQTIQSAIDAAVNGDTVLVYCGEYIENINITNKTICLTSLYLFIQDDSLISNTIINGNRNGSSVIIDNSDNVIINGFTITNGGYVLPNSPCWGGGLFISYSEVTIKFCVIHDNRGKVGGGLCIDHSNVNFIGNTIRHNIGNIVGGGFHALGGSQIIFDEENLNNIYCNLGGAGSDLSFAGTIPATIVVIDTFTVQNPDIFYIQRQDSLTILINNHKIELIDDDLYVAPTGDNDNSGLTQDEPLQTIAYAQMIIKSDSLSNNKIFLEDGIYSFSLNNQVYPLNIKNYVTIIGESRENTILDAEDFNPFYYQACSGIFKTIYYKNITFINGKEYVGFSGWGYLQTYNDLYFENVTITECKGGFVSGLLGKDGTYRFINCDFVHNVGGNPLRISSNHTPNPDPHVIFYMENSRIHNNVPDDDPEDGYGGGVYIGGHSTHNGVYNAVFNNVQFTENYDNLDWMGDGGTSALIVYRQMNADVINCTFGNNIVELLTGQTIAIANDAYINMVNSIFYGNNGTSVVLIESDMTIQNTLFESFEDNMSIDGDSEVIWLDGNINMDPLWLGDGAEFPYALSVGSPCIDTGTLDLPPGIELPEYDLAGNPRIYGDCIDMGAYEWQGVEISEDTIQSEKIELFSYPNPFNPETTIHYQLPEDSEVELIIYNIKGQFVKVLVNDFQNAGEHSIIWDGTDQYRNPLSSGVYLYRLKSDEGVLMSKKMLLLE